MKIRYRLLTKDGSYKIVKNPSDQDLQLWTSSGLTFEKLEGYETLTTRDEDPDLLIKIADDRIKLHLANVRRQLDIHSEKLDKLSKTVNQLADDQDELLEAILEEEMLGRGTRLIALLGAFVAIVALIKGFL